MVNKKDLVATRAVKPEDVNFIFATFLRGLYYGDSWFSQMPKAVFMDNYHKVVQHLLLNEDTKVTVACLNDDPNIILAYVITSVDGATLHWAFCKKAWRSIGIIKDLTPKNLKQVTHLTKTGLSIIKKHEEVTFNPFAIPANTRR